MNIDKDDPRLTAYALDELDGEERAVVAAAIAGDPELRTAVEEIRQLAGAVSEALAAEPCPQLMTVRQTDVLPHQSSKARRLMGSCLFWQSVAAAAVFAAVGLGILASSQRSESRVPLAEASPNGTPLVVEEDGDRGRVEYSSDLHMGPSADRSDYDGETVPYSGTNGQFTTDQEMKLRYNTNSIYVRDMADGERKRGVNIQGAGVSLSDSVIWGFEADSDVSGVALGGTLTPGRYGPSLEDYATVIDNSFRRVSDHPLSTFSIDVDTASYANVRRFLNDGQLPPKDAVRIEEMVNYFPYSYAPPTGDVPFASHLDVAACPWAPKHRLVRVAIKGKDVSEAKRPDSNMVFLIDVSGSMQDANKLPLIKKGMKMLADRLRSRDRVAIVVYAGASGLVLPATEGTGKKAIMAALDALEAGGSTNGGAGIELAYRIAAENYVAKGNNRVILCTDGDFNIGTTTRGDLARLIEEKAKTGVFLSVLGFGTGNTKDATMESLADKGNGNYAYIDTINEARKVLIDQGGGTLLTIAKDVKLQVEFNPTEVAGYRLIGYENRMLAKEDFNDDTKDAGEIGAGHTVTAFYEVVPTAVADTAGPDKPPAVDELRYQSVFMPSAAAQTGELLTLSVRYKAPDGDVSKKLTFALSDTGKKYTATDRDFQFATAVAAFGMILRDSKYKGAATLAWAGETASAAAGRDPFGYRAEFLELVRKATARMKAE